MFLGVLFWYFSLARADSRCPPPHSQNVFSRRISGKGILLSTPERFTKVAVGIDPSWLQHHCVNWNSLPVSIRSACTERDVSTINLYLDSYIDFLQITFLITTCNSIVFVCDSIHSHCKYALSFVFIVILKVD